MLKKKKPLEVCILLKPTKDRIKTAAAQANLQCMENGGGTLSTKDSIMFVESVLDTLEIKH